MDGILNVFKPAGITSFDVIRQIRKISAQKKIGHLGTLDPLAEGVSQALITTVAGLIVAIPAMIAYAYFRNRASRLISDLEAASADLAAELQEQVSR